MAFFQPGDVYVEKVSITGSRGTVDVRPFLFTAAIYESILTPGIVAEIVLHESNDITNILPIVGEETLSITFSTPTRGSATYEMIINKMKGEFAGDNLRNKIYTLECASPHILNDKSTVVNKSWNTQISTMITEIFNNYLKPQKSLTVDAPTNGIQTFIAPNKRPLAAIDMLRRRATSAQNQSGAYLFFENRDEFKLTTLETLFQGSTGDRVYTQQAAANYSENSITFNSIISLNFEQQFDSAAKLAAGGVASEVRQFDFHLLKMVKNIVNIDESSYSRADSGSTTSGTFKGQFNKPGRTYTIPTDSSKAPTGIPETAPHQGAMAALAGQGSVLFNVPGDSQLKVGEMCELKVYIRTSSTGNEELEPNISGKYLITRLRHQINHPKAKPRYICAIEAVKASYKEGV
jgi:hypothetical protein